MKQYLIKITYNTLSPIHSDLEEHVTEMFLVDGESYDDAERTLMASVRNPSDPLNYTMTATGRLKP